jgi:hypothetical protein
MPKQVLFTCKECGRKEMRPKRCPFTGIMHGRGFQYICDCRATMEVQDIDPRTGHISECEKVLKGNGVQ